MCGKCGGWGVRGGEPQPELSKTDWFREGELNQLGAPPGGTEEQKDLRPLLNSTGTIGV